MKQRIRTDTPPQLSIDDFLGHLTGVKKSGSGWTARCPAHEDNHNSLSITTGDDGRILIKCHAGCAFPDIIAALGLEPAQLMGSKPEPVNTRTVKPRIAKTYDYTDAAGNLLYQSVRMIPKDFRQRRPDPDKPGAWIWDLKGVPPTLYKLPELITAIAAGRTVCIVEGEKDVETLAGIGVVATCNSGGAGKWRADFSAHFTGAVVAIIPDNDKPGREHADKVARMLHKHVSQVRIVDLPGLPEHGDVSDWIPHHTPEELRELVLSAPLWEPAPKLEPDDKPTVTEYAEPEAVPFRCLGFNDGHYYYLPNDKLQIISMTADQHTQAALISLAPIQWWEITFPNGKSGPDWNAARNWMYRSSSGVIFDSRRLRGCGTWFDGGKVVQHLGDRLTVDGTVTSINGFKTRYVYNASYPIETDHAEPMSTADAARYLGICRMPTWEKPVSGTLLAGWCVIAPICGALTWRPHIWITGAASSGKTWIMENLLKPVIGDLALSAQSNTTEAGLRQALGVNAYPVIFDEAEGEDLNARRRLQGVLELMRQASSETGAPIIKGTSGGHAMIFMVRSCFVLSSIGVNITQRADSSRVTILSLGKAHPKDAVDMFDELKTVAAATITKQYCAALRARTLQLVPVILQNAQTFGRAVAVMFSDQRIGDQFGALLAGAYSLTSAKTITADDARKWIEAQDWTEQAAIEDMTDEDRCISRIMEHVMVYMVNSSRVERSIGEILYNYGASATPEVNLALERIGIRVATDNGKYRVVLSNSHDGIRKILSDTPWERNWGRILKRIKGAEALQAYRFFGRVSRATSIPMSTIMGEED